MGVSGAAKAIFVSCHLVGNWFEKEELVPSVCGAPGYPLCPFTDKREVEVGIPIDLTGVDEL